MRPDHIASLNHQPVRGDKNDETSYKAKCNAKNATIQAKHRSHELFFIRFWCPVSASVSRGSFSLGLSLIFPEKLVHFEGEEG